MRQSFITVPLLCIGLLALGACGDDADDSDNFGGGADFDPNPEPSADPNPGFDAQPDPEPSPNPEPFIPEEEERFNFQAPQPSRNYVFVANSDLDTVAKIDGDTLEIASIEVGDRPTVVRTWKETNVAVVLNEGSADVSIIHAKVDRDDVVSLPIQEGFNQIVMAPGGVHALAYLDYQSAEPDDDIGRFQDVNLIRLTEGEEAVYNVAVGFRVLEIEFDEEGERAFVVTEDGISVIEMAGVESDIGAQPVPVSDNPLEDAEAIDREVEVTADGSMAIVRTSVLEGVNLVTLGDQRGLTQIALPSVPSDLDIYPDSTRALAVLKQARQIAILDLATLAEDPEAVRLIDVPEGPIGLATIDVASNTALLYSTASAEPRVSRLDLETGALTVWDVRKALSGVHLSPDGQRAVLFHVKGDAPRTNDPSDVFIAGSWAYSVLDVQSGFIKLTTTATEPGEFVFGPEGQTMFVIQSDKAEDVRQIDRINLSTFRVDSVQLGSPPEHIGLLPSNLAPRIYISQEHPVGRMTFVNIEGGDAKTVTGYELNSRIE